MSAHYWCWLFMLTIQCAQVHSQTTTTPYGHEEEAEEEVVVYPCYCPDITTTAPPSGSSPLVVCISNQMNICINYTQAAGACNGSQFYYNSANIEYNWQIQGVVADPQSGKTRCALFTVLSPGRGTIQFSLTASRNSPINCNHSESITRTFDVIQTDLDIDSDNNNGFRIPAGSIEEENIENDARLPGKLIGVNNGDVDHDGVPNFADGFDLNGNQGPNSSGSFVPVIVRLPDPIDLNTATISFNYSAAPPDAVQRTGTGTYADPHFYSPGSSGSLRLWSVNGSASRMVNDIAHGGHFISANTTYQLSQLGSSRTITLYLEGISPSRSLGENQISISIDPDGNGNDFGWMCGDSIRCTVIEAQMATDFNRDRIITFDETDKTTPKRRYRFWLNNDLDKGNDDEAEDHEPISGAVDSSDTIITSLRDLEDFSPLGLRIDAPGSVYDMISSGLITVKLSLLVTTDSASMQIFRAAEQTGEFEYLVDLPAAQRQQSLDMFKNSLGQVSGTVSYQFPNNPESIIRTINSENKFCYFLFEGVGSGAAQIIVTLSYNNNLPFCSSAPVYVQIKDIKQMYEHWTVGDNNDTDAANIPFMPSEVNGLMYTSASIENDDYILFVHGWRMKPWERRYFAETAYKRLFWANYRGKFGFFSWPTGWTDYPAINQMNYDRSEFKAWHSAPGLRNLLSKLNERYPGKVRIMAHSMGNVVASEALRLEAASTSPQRIAHTYVASQAASVACAYDNNANLQIEGDDNTQTPEVYANFPPTGAPYFANLSLSVGRVLNFHNREDDALEWWLLNQDTKPDPGYAWEYFGSDYSQKRWTRNSFGRAYEIMIFPLDSYEIYSFIAESRSSALGAEGLTAGSISAPFNLRDSPNNFGGEAYEHSAQFRSLIMRRLNYWGDLLFLCRIAPGL